MQQVNYNKEGVWQDRRKSTSSSLLSDVVLFVKVIGLAAQ